MPLDLTLRTDVTTAARASAIPSSPIISGRHKPSVAERVTDWGMPTCRAFLPTTPKRSPRACCHFLSKSYGRLRAWRRRHTVASQLQHPAWAGPSPALRPYGR
jgi:hypothetical protein